MDPILELKGRLAKYPELRYTETSYSIDVSPPSHDGFSVSFHVSANEYTVHFDGWHEHFRSAEEALDCFVLAFSGKARLAITYRGSTAVKWVLEHLNETGWHADSEVTRFPTPFWKAKHVVYRQNPNLLRDNQ